MESTVMKLILHPFSQRSLEDQLRIVSEGRPPPDVNAVPQTGGTDIEIVKQLEDLVYCKVQWLTSCPLRKGFFCWPCLLFNQTEGYWNLRGFSDWNSILENMRRHQKCFEHIQAELKLKMFRVQHLKSLDVEAETNMKQHAEIVKRHREVIKVLVDMICDYVAREHVPLKGDNYNGIIDPNDCLRYLEIVREFCSCDPKDTDDAMELIKQSPKIVNDVVDAITAVIKSSIRTEAKNSPYVSVILSEHSDVVNKPLVSTVLRYVNGVKVCERFLGFTDTIGSRQSNGVFQHISNVVEEFDISKRFLAYSLDGGVLPLNELVHLIELMEEKWINFFAPWCSHGLDTILEQGLRSIKECNYFFKTLNTIKCFFNKGSKGFKSFNDFMDQRNDNSILRNNTRWSNRKQIVIVTCIYRKDIIDFFNCVVGNPHTWDADDVAFAFGLRIGLQQFPTVFLLHLFSKIFEFMAPFRAVLKSSTPEKIIGGSACDTFKRDLATLRNCEFENMWLRTVNDVSNPSLPDMDVYRELYSCIINNLIQQVRVRFDDMNKLEFTQLLLRTNCCQNPVSRIVYASQLATELGSSLNCFDTKALCVEMDALQKSGCSFDFDALYEFLVKNDTGKVLPNLFRLSGLCYALPIRRLPAGGCNKLKDIKQWSCHQDGCLKPGDKSVLSVEVDLLGQLRKSETFYDEVIGRVNGTVQFV